jgi:hypothetical protein
MKQAILHALPSHSGYHSSLHELACAHQQYFAHLGLISFSRSCQSCRASHTSSSRSSASALRLRKTAPDLILLLQSSSCCSSSDASTCLPTCTAGSSQLVQSKQHRVNTVDSTSHHAIVSDVKASRRACRTATTLRYAFMRCAGVAQQAC